jgi:hypothetical protein
MKTDVYTKTILTIIAVCLLIICLQSGGIVSEARAEKSLPSKYAVVPVNEDGTINVRIMATHGVQNVVIAGWKESDNDSDYSVKGLSKNPLPVETK